MRSFLVVSGFLFATSPAVAEWHLINIATNGSMATYVDPTTIRKDGNVRRAWFLQDFKEPHPREGMRSVKMLHEIDCAEEKFRVLQFVAFKESMGAGDIGLSGNEPSSWNFAPPNSINDAKIKFVCRHARRRFAHVPS